MHPWYPTEDEFTDGHLYGEWVEFTGENRPDSTTLVQVLTYSDRKTKNEDIGAASRAKNFNWDQPVKDYEIVAYRLKK